MNAIEKLREITIRQYRDFIAETQPELKKKKLLLIEKMLLELVSQDPKAVDYYVWGIVHYHADPVNYITAIEKFKASIQLDPEYYMAHMYEGHCYFDCKEWGLALAAFQRVNQERLRAEFPLWRFIKLQELMGVCHFQLGEKDLGWVDLKKVIQAYQENNYVDLARPTELMLLLEEQGEASILHELKIRIEEE